MKNNDYEWKPCALVIFIMSLSVRLSDWIYLRYTCQKLRKIFRFFKCEMNDLAIHYWGAMILSVFFNIEGCHRHHGGYFYHNLNMIRRKWSGLSITTKNQIVYRVQLAEDRKWWKKPNRFTPNRLITNVEKQIFWRNGIQTAFSCNRTSFAVY